MFENAINIGYIFSVKNIIIYLIIINLIGFYMMWSDKREQNGENGEFQRTHYLWLQH